MPKKYHLDPTSLKSWLSSLLRPLCFASYRSFIANQINRQAPTSRNRPGSGGTSTTGPYLRDLFLLPFDAPLFSSKPTSAGARPDSRHFFINLPIDRMNQNPWWLLLKFNLIQTTREKELRSVNSFDRDHKTIFPHPSRYSFLPRCIRRPPVDDFTTHRSKPASSGRAASRIKKEEKKGTTLSAEPRGYVVITINDHNYAFSLASCYRVVLSCFPVSRYSAHRALKKKKRVTYASGLSFSRSGKRDAAEVHDSRPCEHDRTNGRARAHAWMRRINASRFPRLSLNSYWPSCRYQRESRAIINCRPEM